MTLRKTLLGLIGLAGLIVTATTGGLSLAAATDYAALRAALASDRDRNALVALVSALDAEDLARIDTATGHTAVALANATQRSDTALKAALDRLDSGTAPPGDARLLREFAASLARQRIADSQPQILRSTGHSSEWHRRLTPQYLGLERIMSGAQTVPTAGHPGLAPHALAALRSLCLRSARSLTRKRILIEMHLATALHSDTDASLAFARRETGETAELKGLALAAEDHARLVPAAFADPAAQALARIGTLYHPAETALLDTHSAGNASPPALARWREASRLALAELAQAEATLMATTTALAKADLRHALIRLCLFTGATVLSLGLAATALRRTARHILAPLDRIASRLDALSRPDITVPQPANSPLRDIAAMDDALHHICAEAERRSRMQTELARLADRVVADNREMTADLEAAARVQRSQLPATPLCYRAGTLYAFFRPSRVVAGDTYDCLSLPDGRLRLFQIDVSGHGAPAALVSVASHIALKQALLNAPPSEALADIIARTNRDWAEDLPYFTLLAVEIDPATATASIVQCGHPALIRLPATGGYETLGNGGLPIGVLPDAAFSTVTCPFATGDRLVLVTDGLTETTDPDAQMFGEDRLRDLLTFRPHEPVPRLFDRTERALWDWRGSEILDDDITILVLEAT